MATKTSSSQSAQRRLQRKQQIEAERRKKLLWQLGLVAAVAVLLVGGFAYWSLRSGSDDGYTAFDYGSIPMDGMTLGATDAPITLVEYGDYRCIHCADFAVDTMPQLIADFVKDGKVRIEFRPIPLLGGVAVDDPTNGSVLAVQSAMCASDQGAFWPYHDALMASFQQTGKSGEAQFRSAATDAGIDPDALMSCVSAGTHRQAAIDAYTTGTAQGVSGTPTLLLNGTMITWTGDYSILKKQIESLIGS